MGSNIVLTSTLDNFIEGEMENIMRSRPFLAMIKAQGAIKFNEGGDDLNWLVRYKRTTMVPIGDNGTATFQQVVKRKIAKLPVRAYVCPQGINKMTKVKNKGKAARIKLLATMAEELTDDIGDQFAEELYVDGNAAGNTLKWHGLESAMGITGTGSTAGFVSVNDDNYAGLDTDLGAYGGTWTATSWPRGNGSSQYDFWSPLIIDYTDGSWTASTKTWPNTCVEAIRFGIVHSRRNATKLDFFMLSNELYRQLLENIDDKEQINVMRGGDNALVKLGFGDTVSIDGVPVTSEYGVPDGVGYGISIAKGKNLRLHSWQKQLFQMEKDYDIESFTDRFAVDCYGNMRFNPRNQVKFNADS
jgi:hypothetical protein